MSSLTARSRACPNARPLTLLTAYGASRNVGGCTPASPHSPCSSSTSSREFSGVSSRNRLRRLIHHGCSQYRTPARPKTRPVPSAIHASAGHRIGTAKFNVKKTIHVVASTEAISSTNSVVVPAGSLIGGSRGSSGSDGEGSSANSESASIAVICRAAFLVGVPGALPHQRVGDALRDVLRSAVGDHHL